MTSQRASLFALVVICLSACLWIGCSDNTITTVISEDDLVADGPSDFLPLEEGFTTVYAVTFSDGTDDVITLEVGDQVQIGTVNAIEWNSSGENGMETGYLRATSNAVYFYESASSDPEKILELPLEVGAEWLRFSDEYAGDDFIDIITSVDDDKEDESTEGEPNAKTFPSTGGNTMTVVSQEPVELSDGSYFANAWKLSNDGSVPGKKNYYWFVDGIGMVKYVLGTTDGSSPRGDVEAELTDYGA